MEKMLEDIQKAWRTIDFDHLKILQESLALCKQAIFFKIGAV